MEQKARGLEDKGGSMSEDIKNISIEARSFIINDIRDNALEAFCRVSRKSPNVKEAVGEWAGKVYDRIKLLEDSLNESTPASQDAASKGEA